MSTPSAQELMKRKTLGIGPETVTNQQSTDFPGHWPGESHEWDLDYFKETFNVEFHKHSPTDSQFSLTHVDTSIANAFRRILLAEIPTLAIEDVFIYQNTSIIQDEVLAQRLGLIPLCGSRDGLRAMTWYSKPTDDDPGSGTPSDSNTVVLRLEAECTWQEGGLQRAVAGETDPDKLYVGHNVYAKDIVFKPIGAQADTFSSERGAIRSTNPEILICKMRPGQSINLSMHAIKGIGQDHAKFSPVATASYRLMPTIDITQPIIGADAKKFARCFPRGVIALDTVTAEDAQKHPELKGKEGVSKAVVANAMNDTVSRECLRHPEFKDKVKLGRIRDHFIFRIESTGQWESDELFLESVKLLKIKCQRIKRGLDEMMK
ncbi:RBP11-like subunits of RNA polymerase [Decorospora gaudefroyi]|uniref:DNA-directed RNA polymerases I and III subunit RPAC1 n=1 Tax=Decorospora gaudefroyi TaxID=184978 RepID=A0A6A5K8N2_9PLEO|nr:RBP11-like subunits of RNA polymerase [Decorospora gaudefroyi]